MSRDPRFNQRQLWDTALNRKLPPLARYVVAEALTSEAVEADPRGYAVAVAQSEGWPDWLRLLLLRPMAYHAATGRPLPRESLDELTRHADPAIGLWATFTLAASGDGQDANAVRLRSSADSAGTWQPLANLMLQALEAPTLANRRAALDTATLWLRSNHPGVSALWSGWIVEDGKLVPDPATKLP